MSLEDALARCGTAGRLVASLDWSATPLGPPSGWPPCIAGAVELALACGFPLSVAVGPDPSQARLVYNDAFIAFLGHKHPAAMGHRAREVWPETCDFFEWAMRQTRQTARSVTGKDLSLRVERGDDLEEIYASLSFSPIWDAAGDYAGALVCAMETTAAVVGERREHVLRGMAEDLCKTRTEEELYGVLATALSAAVKDVAFAALYVLDADGRRAALRVSVGLDRGALGAAPEVNLEADPAGPWGLAGVVRARRMRVVASTGVPLSAMVSLAGTPRLAAVVPVTCSTDDTPLGVLVVGLSPVRPFDDACDGFVRLVAHQISAALANVRRLQGARRQAESLAALDRAKTMFLTNVSHELRTPLTLLLGATEELLAGASEPLSAAQQVELGGIRRNAYRLLRYVTAMLDFARTDVGHASVVYEPTELAGFTREIVEAFQPLCARAGLRLEVECPLLPEPVVVARELWEQIVLNLVSNALKFTFSGEISVRLLPVGERVVLTVRDTGVGIPEEALPRVFERFYRVPGTPARTGEGMGIGLALVKELVALHAGSIRVTSAPGEGTTFTIEIPRRPDHAPQARAREPPSSKAVPRHLVPSVEEARGWLAEPAGRVTDGQAESFAAAHPDGAPPRSSAGRILIAEDSVYMREHLVRLLGSTYEVEAVPDGAVALQRARVRAPDLVLSDVIMPQMDGLSLLRALRSDPQTSDVPIVLISARSGEDATVDALGSGADDYLVKPFSARELRARVRTHLELARSRREAGESRLKDVFLGLASHELRTPLTCLKMNVQLVQQKLEATDSRLAARLAGLHESIDRMTRLVDEMLCISAISAGKLTLRRRCCDLREVCRAAAAEQAQVSRRELTLALPDTPVPALIDEDRLGQVVSNLLSNALKYSTADRPVILALRTAGQEAIITVKDQGSGIPAADLLHIFERFYRAPGVDVQSGSYLGLGLGLFLAKGIVEQHSGRIWAESVQGEGSAFSFTVPLVS